MLPNSQPARPKLQQAPVVTVNHQQIRTLQSSAPQSATSSPRNQMEAMPPFSPMPNSHPLRAVYDSATRHPVFFTQQLYKPPFPLPAQANNGLHPVASGYVFEQKPPDAHNGKHKTKL